MKREESAGGVVLRRAGDGWELAAIRPRGKAVWALPKGHPNPGEPYETGAQREVREETGLETRVIEPLGAITYVYQLGGQRILKTVRFFLLAWVSGEIDAIEPAMRVEVDRAAWIPLGEAPQVLAYKGEREVVERAVGKLPSTFR